MRVDLLKHLRLSSSDAHLNRKVFVFLICLCISFFAWLQINLSKEHTEVVPVRMDYTSLPPKRFGTTVLTDTLMVEVESNGYGLLKYKTRTVTIDFKKLKKDASGAYYFLPNNYTKTISRQMGENFKVLRALTDTVQLNLRARL